MNHHDENETGVGCGRGIVIGLCLWTIGLCSCMALWNLVQ